MKFFLSLATPLDLGGYLRQADDFLGDVRQVDRVPKHYLATSAGYCRECLCGANYVDRAHGDRLSIDITKMRVKPDAPDLDRVDAWEINRNGFSFPRLSLGPGSEEGISELTSTTSKKMDDI